MTDFKSLLAGAQLPRRSVEICLRGDLTARFEELERELAAVVERPESQSIEDEPEALRIAREIEAVRAEMQEHSYTFVVQALPRPAYQSLKSEHPPRQNDEGEIRQEDAVLDANYDTFLEPLLRASLVDPEMDEATWAELVGKLSENQYNSLINAAYMVNKGGISVPFSRAASALLSSSGSE